MPLLRAEEFAPLGCRLVGSVDPVPDLTILRASQLCYTCVLSQCFKKFCNERCIVGGLMLKSIVV